MHRDVKPSNTMLTMDDEVRLLDFDLAIFFLPGEEYSYDVATPGYKSPEVILHQYKYDFRHDIYSTGCMMLAMLMKEHPYFDTYDGEKDWHSMVLVRGVDAVKKVDLRHKIKRKYQKKWKWIQPYSLFESFQKNIRELNESDDEFEDYYNAFEVVEEMLTLDYQ